MILLTGDSVINGRRRNSRLLRVIELVDARDNFQVFNEHASHFTKDGLAEVFSEQFIIRP